MAILSAFESLGADLAEQPEDNGSTGVMARNSRSPKSEGLGNTIKALNQENKGWYLGAPATALVAGAGVKYAYNKNYATSMKAILEAGREEQKLLNIAKNASKGGYDIRSGSNQFSLANPRGGLSQTLGANKPISLMTKAEKVSLARLNAIEKTIPFVGNSLKQYSPVVQAPSAEFPNSINRYMAKGGQLVDAVTPKIVKEVAPKVFKTLGKVGTGLSGIASAGKLLNTGNIYDYYTEDARRGIDPNQSTEYMGINVPNRYLTDYVAPLQGVNKSVQNIGEVARDMLTYGASAGLREFGLPALLGKNLDDKEAQQKAVYIDQLTSTGVNEIEAEKRAQKLIESHRIVDANEEARLDAEWAKNNKGMPSRQQMKKMTGGGAEYFASLLNAEIPPPR